MGGTFDNRINAEVIVWSTPACWLEKRDGFGVGSSGAYYWVLKVQSPARECLVVVPSGQGLRNVLFVAAGLVVR